MQFSRNNFTLQKIICVVLHNDGKQRKNLFTTQTYFGAWQFICFKQSQFMSAEPVSFKYNVSACLFSKHEHYYVIHIYSCLYIHIVNVSTLHVYYMYNLNKRLTDFKQWKKPALKAKAWDNCALYWIIHAYNNRFMCYTNFKGKNMDKYFEVSI